MKTYEETNIDAQIMKIADEEKNFLWDKVFSERAVRLLFEGMAKYLGTVKRKGAVMGCQIRDIKSDKFFIGAYVENNTSEDGEDSFSLTYTFKEDDMKDIPRENIALLSDTVFHYTVSDMSMTNYGLSLEVFNGRDYLADILCVAARAISDYMIANVDIDPELDIPDMVKCVAEHDGNDIVIGVTPYEVLKQHVKDDRVSERVNEETVEAYSPKGAAPKAA